MKLSSTSVIAGVAAAFVVVGVNLARHQPTGVTSLHETGPFRTFTQDESGRYVAGFDPQTQAGKPTASVYCFPVHPTAYVAGRQVQLDTTTNQVTLVVRGVDGKTQQQPTEAGLGADIKAACTAIRRDADASDAVNRMAQRLVL